MSVCMWNLQNPVLSNFSVLMHPWCWCRIRTFRTCTGEFSWSSSTSSTSQPLHVQQDSPFLPGRLLHSFLPQVAGLLQPHPTPCQHMWGNSPAEGYCSKGDGLSHLDQKGGGICNLEAITAPLRSHIQWPWGMSLWLWGGHQDGSVWHVTSPWHEVITPTEHHCFIVLHMHA